MPDFYNNLENVQKAGKELKIREQKYSQIKELENLIGQSETALELLQLEDDEQTETLLLGLFDSLTQKLTTLKIAFACCHFDKRQWPFRRFS